MYEHDFIDDRLWRIYRESCRIDFTSPRCMYFQYELELDEDNVNPYSKLILILDVYELCKEFKSAEAARMVQAIRKFRKVSAKRAKLANS